MEISEAAWDRYIKLMRATSDKAGSLMLEYLNSHDVSTAEGHRAAIEYACVLVVKYGEASASWACEMYDAIAAAQGVLVPPAEPAATATYQETAKAIIGTEKNRRNSVPQTVGRLVKQAGADTMLKNAARDGAEFAWIPKGDTCAFCIMLASRGWQRQRKKKHAEHIHANCDCNYSVRFDGKSTVAGYKPEKYLLLYNAAGGVAWEDKVNSLRREFYAENSAAINEQKRSAYAKRKE